MENLIIILLCLPGITRKSINSILTSIEKQPKNENDLLDMIINLKLNNKKIVIPTIEQVKTAISKSEDIILKLSNQNIKYIDICNENFPKELVNIKNPPVMLFYKGNYESIVNDKSVAIIGSRKTSIKGLTASYELGYRFGNEGYSVVSGLAKGCDEQAHRGCLDAKGKTIAVLPSSLDNIYPHSNKQLAQKILENNGCLISEYLIESNIYKYNFIERDRLQSALSRAVIVCETSINGGTMHTVNFSKEQEKILACLDINIDGNQKIIKENECIKINNDLDIENLITKIEQCKDNKLLKKDKIIYEQLKINFQ